MGGTIEERGRELLESSSELLVSYWHTDSCSGLLVDSLRKETRKGTKIEINVFNSII